MDSSCKNKINNTAKQEVTKNLNDVPVYSSYIADILIQEDYKLNRIRPNKNKVDRKNLYVFYFERSPEIKERIEELSNIRKINAHKKED